ncbi:MAG TPA: hypothetical protein VFR19_10440 [Hyphomicrobiaceae bacterium]|jgi:hypothetical protein|nr:hypothetical protein [Hyphomicrobiaceae bacterium]
MLRQLSILAAASAGFVNAPWWFWLVAALALAVLGLTDPDEVHPRYADGGIAQLLVADSLARFASACAASGGAFAGGRFAALFMFP